MRQTIIGTGLALLLSGAGSGAALLPPPSATIVPQAYGFVMVPGAAIKPQRIQKYHAVFSATTGAAKPDKLIPAIQMAGTGAPLDTKDFKVLLKPSVKQLPN